MSYHVLTTLRDLVVPIGDAIRPRLSDVKVLQERFLTGQQQDAHEFLSFLLEHIESEHLRPQPLEEASSVDVNAVARMQSRRLGNRRNPGKPTPSSPSRRPMGSRPAMNRSTDSARTAPGLTSFIRLSTAMQGPVLWRPTSGSPPAAAALSSPSSSASPRSRKGILHLENPLSGLLESTLYCPHCDREWSTMQKMLNLSLYTPSGQRATFVSLEECLRAFAAPEEVEGVWCSTCGQKRTLLKRMSIARPPRVLCLHLHRIHSASGGPFSAVPTLRKTTTHIQFPTTLNVGAYTASRLGSLSRPPPRGALPSASWQPMRALDLQAHRNKIAEIKQSEDIEEDETGRDDKSSGSSFLFSMFGSIMSSPLQAPDVFPENPPSTGTDSRPLSRSSSANSLTDIPVADIVDSESVREYEKDLLPNLALNRRSDSLGFGSDASLTTSFDPLRRFTDKLRGLRSSSDQGPRYVLSAVIVHIGSERGGHYIAFKRVDPTLQFSTIQEYDTKLKQTGSPDAAVSPLWLRISDDRVEMVDESFVLQSEAYMLFYSQV
jgi:hypothetical protein